MGSYYSLIPRYIDGEYRGRRYDYFDNSAFVFILLFSFILQIAKCDKNIFPEGSRLLSVDTTSTNGLSFAACSDVIAKSSRPVTISVETSVPSPNDMNAYYPIQPFLVCLRLPLRILSRKKPQN